MVTWKRDLVCDPTPASTSDFAAARGIASGAGNPLIAFSREAWETMQAHVAGASIEVGGVLAGTVFADPVDGRLLIDVTAALPARGALESAAYFQLTPAAWDHISRAREAGDDDLPLIGWYHSHPGLGVFYSGTDRASQRAFFRRPWNFGVVIDPVRNDWAIFLGPESRRLEARQVTWYSVRSGQPIQEQPAGTVPDARRQAPAPVGVTSGPMGAVPIAPVPGSRPGNPLPTGKLLPARGVGLVGYKIILSALAGALGGVALRESWRWFRLRRHSRG